jgi:exodeoxyribonuclease VII large subunit
VGHEIDFTIADFVADVRAPTPSGAAELVTPDGSSWLLRLARLSDRFSAAVRRAMGAELRQVTALTQRLQRAMQILSARHATHLKALTHRLQQAHPGTRLQQLALRLEQLDSRLQRSMRVHLAHQGTRLDSAARALQTVSPLATLGRGFAVITRSADGALVTSAQQLQIGEEFDAQLAEGYLHAKLIERRS